ncbi:hypothetical protein EB235_27355 [Mesorhizobium loti R88b]|uniref:Uncharacterized protein n=1 Tax=Mesorhizobium loti R88b TaxID=935548 RepID=A0A6M7WRP5_RHILI|nr:hypothetical protein EB235_27355 [Mesorhizobium loti R88b]
MQFPRESAMRFSRENRFTLFLALLQQQAVALAPQWRRGHSFAFVCPRSGQNRNRLSPQVLSGTGNSGR